MNEVKRSVFLHHDGYGPTFEGVESKCHLCDAMLKPAKNGLYGKVMSDHLRMVHDGMRREQYHIVAFFGGKSPTCCCMRCIVSDTPAPVTWTSNGFRRFATGHNRTITEARPVDITTSGNECRECGRGFASLRALASHVKPTHDLTTEEYVIKHMYDGEPPTCDLDGCTTQPRFDRSTWTFKRFCVDHSHVAESLAGKKGGSAASPHKGETKLTRDFFRVVSERQLGERNHFYGQHHTDEAKQRIAVSSRITREEFTLRTTRKSQEYVVLTPYDSYVSRQQPLDVRCQLCNLEFQATLENLDRDCSRCVKCFPSMNRSRAEDEITTFIEELGFEVVRNDRTVLGGNKEVDVWVPSKSFGVEHNGLWWHCEANSTNSHRMREKLEASRAVGVSILHVFEDEWLNRRSILEGMIRCRLGVPMLKLHARSCSIAEIDAGTARTFLDENHLDGVGGPCPLRFGLFTRDEQLVAVITLRAPQQHSRWPQHIEVKRFATLKGVSVRGALGKLIKHVKLHLQTTGRTVNIMTYVHLRHGEGASYEAVGFVKQSETRHGFWWTTGGGRRMHRLKVKADPQRGLSERQIAAERGVHRIYDCGVVTFELKA